VARRVQVPWLEAAETNCTLSGRISLTLHSRSEGSRLVFLMVKVTGSPKVTLSGRAAISRKALCVCTMLAISTSAIPTTMNFEADRLTSFPRL
jgi:hypothetical protein